MTESTDTLEASWSPMRFLWERKWWVVAGIVVGVALAVVATARQARIYQATCTLEYDPSPPRPLGREVEDVATPFVQAWRVTEWYETQNQILSSRNVAERVVERLGLHRDPDFMGVPEERRGQWKGVEVAEAAERLRAKLSVTRLPETRLVEISVRDPDPKRAALLANAIADAYIERTLEVRLESTMRALEFLSSQLENKSKELNEAELALHEFKKQNNVLSIALEDQQNVVVQDLQRYSAALSEARRRRIEVASRLAALRQANDEDPMRIRAQVVDGNPVVQQLRTQLRQEEARLAALLARYGENWPEVAVARASVERLRKELRAEIQGVIRSVEAELRELQRTEEGLRQALEQVRAKGMELNLKEIEYRKLARQRNNREKLFSILLERATETDLTRAMNVSTANVVDRALAPKHPILPRVPFNVAAGLFLGSFLGLGLALLAARMDRRIKEVGDLERLGPPVLGIVPHLGADKAGAGAYRYAAKGAPQEPIPDLPPESHPLLVHYAPASTAAETIRAIRTQLTFMSLESPLSTLSVTSAAPYEGKTTVAVSLAISFAQAGKRVLLVDADMRRPRVHRIFGWRPRMGLSTVLIGETSLAEAVHETEVPGLQVLPCGPIPPNPAELLHHERFHRFMDEAKGTYDVVLFDSPPVGPVTDPVVLGRQVDGVVVVARAGSSNADEIHRALRQMRRVEARVLGFVMNDADSTTGSYRGGYYRYYAQDPDETDDGSPPPAGGGGSGGGERDAAGRKRHAATSPPAMS